MKKILLFILMVSPILWSFGEKTIFSIGSVSFNIPVIVGGGVFLLWGMFLVKPIKNDKITNVLRIICLTYAILGIPTLLFSQSLTQGIGVYARVFSPYVLLFALYHYSRNSNDVRKNLNFLANAIFFIFLSYIVGFINGDVTTNFGGVSRIRASYVPATEWAAYLMVVAGIFFFVLTFQKKKPLILFQILAILLLIAGCVVTYNRTAWVGLFIIILFSALLQRDQKISKYLILALIIFAVLNIDLLKDQFLRYSTNLSNSNDLDLILSGRNSVNSINLHYFFTQAPIINKIFGIGFYNSAKITFASLGSGTYIHNDFLSVLIEQGLLSFILYISFILGLGIILIKDYIRFFHRSYYSDKVAVIIGLYVSMVVTGLVGCWYGRILNSWFIFALFGIYFAYRKIGFEKSNFSTLSKSEVLKNDSL